MNSFNLKKCLAVAMFVGLVGSIHADAREFRSDYRLAMECKLPTGGFSAKIPAKLVLQVYADSVSNGAFAQLAEIFDYTVVQKRADGSISRERVKGVDVNTLPLNIYEDGMASFSSPLTNTDKVEGLLVQPKTQDLNHRRFRTFDATLSVTDGYRNLMWAELSKISFVDGDQANQDLFASYDFNRVTSVDVKCVMYKRF